MNGNRSNGRRGLVNGNRSNGSRGLVNGNRSDWNDRDAGGLVSWAVLDFRSTAGDDNRNSSVSGCPWGRSTSDNGGCIVLDLHLAVGDLIEQLLTHGHGGGAQSDESKRVTHFDDKTCGW